MALDTSTISPLGFGCMRFEGRETDSIDIDATARMVDAYLTHGGNYFDTAWAYPNSEAARCAPRTSRARMAAPPVPSSKSPFPKSASDVHRMPSLQSRNVRVMAELGSAFILDAVRKSEMRQLLRDAVSFHKGRNHHGHPQGQQPDEGLR